MLRSRWYLITVDFEIKDHLNLKSEKNGKYYVAFITRHPDDK